MRALAQSLAREFGPRGVHVAHAIIDGVIDIERTKAWKLDGPDAKISPHAVRYPAISGRVSQAREISDHAEDCGFVLVPPYSATNVFHERTGYPTLH
jgi:NAD(P)-dependent dehydrogenase (short-subunit alcohol dehydrogenase family)